MTYTDTKVMNDAAINAGSSSAMGWLDAKLIDLMPLAVYVCAAPSGLIVRYNERAVELWGRRPHLGETGERFCGAYRLFWMDGTPLPHANTPMAQVLRTGEPVRDQEVLIERTDGSRVAVIVNIDVIRDEQQNIVGAVNVLKDVTGWLMSNMNPNACVVSTKPSSPPFLILFISSISISDSPTPTMHC
jgi:hypothetical protein